MEKDIKYVYLLKDHHRSIQDVFASFKDAEAEALKQIEAFHGLENLEKIDMPSMCYTRYFVIEDDRLMLKRSIVRRIVK